MEITKIIFGGIILYLCSIGTYHEVNRFLKWLVKKLKRINKDNK